MIGFRTTSSVEQLSRLDPADIPGIVKEKKLFKEEAASEDNFFVDIPGQENATPAPAVEETIEPEPQMATVSEEPSGEAGANDTDNLSDDGFLTGPGRGRKEEPATPAAELPDDVGVAQVANTDDDGTDAAETDPDVIDLYTLGAVDYEPQGAVPNN